MKLTKEKYVKILKELKPKLRGVDFAILGTGNLLLRGLSFTPSDVDLITTDVGVEKAAKIFNASISRDKDYGFMYFEAEFNGFVLNFVSAEHNSLRGIKVMEEADRLMIGEVEIRALCLESELWAYERMSRDKDVPKIKAIKDSLV